MAIFSKKKKTLDEILEDVGSLSPEEAKELREKMADLYKAEDEREIDKIEEEKAETEEVKDEKSEEVSEESKEIGKDVDEVKDEAETAEESKAEETPDEHKDVDEAILARIEALESSYSAMVEKFEAMAEKLDSGNFGNVGSKSADNFEDGESDDSRVMRSYYRKQSDARR